MLFVVSHRPLPPIVRTRALALVLLASTLAACASGPPRAPDDVCSMFEQKRHWYKSAREAEAKWGTSMHIPLAIMYQESLFRAKARPQRTRLLGFVPWRRPSSAYGFAQALTGTWRGYLDATGEYWRERHDFDDANDFIHWYIDEAVRVNRISRADAASLYLSYHEGPTGFRRGTYHDKPWLLKAATGVQVRSQRYAQQYAGCRARLQPGFWGRLFGR